MAAVVCVNSECPEHGIEKELAIDLAPDEAVLCGGLIPGVGPCATPCVVRT